MHEGVCNVWVVSEEPVEESPVVDEINYSAGLSDAVHAQHGCSNICSLYSCLCSHHRADSWATSGIILDDEVLHGYLGLESNSSHKSSWNSVCHVPLIGVSLENNTLVDFRGVLRLMLLLIVGVKTMSHVSGEQETLSDCSVVVTHLVVRSQRLKDSQSHFSSHIWVSTLSWLRTYLLMIEKHNHWHFSVVVFLLVNIDDCVKRHQRWSKIVKSGRRHEFLMKTNKLRRLGIDHVQLKVNNLTSLDAQVIWDSVQKSLEMLFLNSVLVFFWRNRLNIFTKELIYNWAC